MSFFSLFFPFFFVLFISIQAIFGEQVTFGFNSNDGGKNSITKTDPVSGLTLTINPISPNSLSDSDGLYLCFCSSGSFWSLPFSFDKSVTLKSILFGYATPTFGQVFSTVLVGTGAKSESFSFLSDAPVITNELRTFQNDINLASNEDIVVSTNQEGSIMQLKSITVEINSEIVGDPHIIGLDGSKFDFAGVPGRIYSIISSPGFQLNAQFIESEGFTYIGQIGAFFQNNDSLIYHPSGELFFNGKKVDISMEWMTRETIWGKFHLTKDHFIIETPNWMIKSGMTTDPVAQFSFNNFWSISFRGKMNLQDIHGLVGHTIRSRIPAEDCSEHLLNGGCFIEGHESDYQVQGILDTKFTFSKFSIHSTTDNKTKQLLESTKEASLKNY